MNNRSNRYFLLIARPDREVEVREYGNDQVAATNAYNQQEAEFREQPGVEVVLLGADSLETLRRTHSHYFIHSSKELISQLEHELAGAADGRRRS